MNLLIVANNVEGNVDGVGKHARMLSEEFERIGHCTTLLSSTSGFNKYFSFITLSMSSVFLKAIVKVNQNRYDYIIIEYPFKEHNPLIVIFHVLLYIVAHAKKTKIAFSMHEYDRVNILRKKVIDVFLKYSDLVFVSEIKYLTKFSKIANKMRVRTIPNHIVCTKVNKKYNPHSFCYFGLVNASKAFKEMLDAWMAFNKEKQCTLEIISSSDLSEWNLNQYKGVKYYHNLSGEKVVDIMFNCSYSIIPVLPNIGYNNSSFVSSIQCGCVPIGVFSPSLSNHNFVVNIKNYDVETFSSSINYAFNLNESHFKTMSTACREFGKNFSLQKTAKQMISAFEELNNY